LLFAPTGACKEQPFINISATDKCGNSLLLCRRNGRGSIANFQEFEALFAMIAPSFLDSEEMRENFYEIINYVHQANPR